jgi:hypothetical protein
VTKQDDLIAYLFDRQRSRLPAPLREWMLASPRFTAFVETYRDKIRKKIRVTRDAEGLLDLLGELQVACCLLDDRRLEVTYEPYASAKQRGADFAVTYRKNLVFNVEVARLRESGHAPAGDRLLRVLLNKLGQMQAGMPNLLAVHVPPSLAGSIDIDHLMLQVKQRADRKDPTLFAAGRYRGPADFYRDFIHLNAVLLWADGGPLWINKQARRSLDEKVLRLVHTLACGPVNL